MTASPERPPDQAADKPVQVRYRRVVLALDSSGDEAEALDLIAALAARLGADISGLFIEDIDLLRLAALPGTRVVSTLSRGAGDITPATIERSLRGRMALVRRAMEEAARRRRVVSSFEVRQGRVVTEAVGAAEESDLVVINLIRGHIPGGRVQRLGEVAKAFAAGHARALLLLRRGARFDGPVMAVYDGGPAAERALEAAAQLATVTPNEPGTTRPVEVVLITSRLDELERWRVAIAAELDGRGIGARFVHLWDRDLAKLARAACRDHATILVAGATASLLEGDGLQKLLDQTDSSVLLVK